MPIQEFPVQTTAARKNPWILHYKVLHQKSVRYNHSSPRGILEVTCIPFAVADQLLIAACDGFSFVHFHLAYRLSEPLVVDCFPASPHRQPVVRPSTSFATMPSMEEICRFLILSEKFD